MSYASRLVQMSKPVAPVGATPSVAPISEIHDEVEAPAMASSAPRATSTLPAPRVPRDRVETIEHRVERERVVQERVAPPAVKVIDAAIEAPQVAMAPPSWRDEDPAGDPLERVEANEDLRAVLRAVRAWIAEPVKPKTELAPAPIEITNVTTNVATPEPRSMEPAQREQTQIVERREEQTQVSIGNVVITVEDAPTPRGAPPRPQAPRLGETASRLARHYVRSR